MASQEMKSGAEGNWRAAIKYGCRRYRDQKWNRTSNFRKRTKRRVLGRLTGNRSTPRLKYCGGGDSKIISAGGTIFIREIERAAARAQSLPSENKKPETKERA